MSSLQKKVQLSRLPPRPHVPGSSSSSAASKSHGFGRRRDFTPVSWNLYFESMDDVEVGEGDDKGTFRVYRSGSEGPVLLLLHGGGHSALSWAVFTAAISSNIECRVVAVDLRGHGDTHVSNPEDLSAETMAKDVGAVVEALYGENPLPVIMVGHSMGGAIAVHAATANVIPTLVGLIVIDVVEGTAMDALNSMQNFLRGRPKTFKSVENAIEWSVKSGQIRNLESARVSMGGQVKRCESGNSSPSKGNGSFCEGIQEEDEEGDKEESNHTTQPASPPQSEEGPLYTWRIDLSTTERFWEGWFRGLSMLFLSCPVPKMLLLAGVDRLDKDLTIGQMQGKFQMQVLPQCGHAVHEDAPDKVADAISTFMLRHRVVESKGDFKVFLPGC
ncbi:protein phosphatase methylesterase 1 [Petromyzon marinus]|uniref:Protein phosphatase methylesterase 1 n=1 Tax=Petromyzon marinus TaxID=7757 RepID=A0AAJ7T6X3_PETMA|nr:protein phosphatase methylesterase 1 isoform X1 [Petromyzon marinus]